MSLSSILKGSDSLAASNVIGSNIFNVLVVLGISSLITPLKVKSRIVRRDVPLLMAISVAVWAMSSTGLLTFQAGIFLIFCLVLNTIWEINTINEKGDDTKDAEPEIEELNENYKGKLNIVLKLILGIFLLSFGSNILVNGSQTLATILGVNEIIIGLTIVATGTSLPELVTSIIAAFKGKTDLAIGNVIGSMVLTTFACLPIFWSKGKISRIEGFILLNLYIFYILDKILYLNRFNYLSELRIGLFIYFSLLTIFLFAQEKLKFSKS